MSNQAWSYLLTFVGLTGFILAGRKVWWCWYINIACQGLWLAYAFITHQYGFVVGAVVYSWVFGLNAKKWTQERFPKKQNPMSLDEMLGHVKPARELRDPND